MPDPDEVQKKVKQFFAETKSKASCEIVQELIDMAIAASDLLKNLPIVLMLIFISIDFVTTAQGIKFMIYDSYNGRGYFDDYIYDGLCITKEKV